jgi:hypothetical protein
LPFSSSFPFLAEEYSSPSPESELALVLILEASGSAFHSIGHQILPHKLDRTPRHIFGHAPDSGETKITKNGTCARPTSSRTKRRDNFLT